MPFNGIPDELIKAGKLPVPIAWQGQQLSEFKVGPLTVEADERSEQYLPGWIDGGLIYNAQVARMTPEQRAKEKIPDDFRPSVSAEDERRALRMINTAYSVRCRFRVLYLGGMPPAEIPGVLLKMSARDFDVVVRACREVDEAEEGFRREAQGDAVSRPAAGQVGHPADADDNAAADL